jgi:PIN domain nuclease of toxin-antitoxin system
LRVLLDTHALLWWDGDDRRLSQRARELIEHRETELILSVASVWEMVIKVARGRLRLGLPPDRLIAEAQQEQGLITLPVELAHALAVADLPRQHADPFDRLLIAQARVEGLPIVTSDPVFAKYDIDTVW